MKTVLAYKNPDIEYRFDPPRNEPRVVKNLEHPEQGQLIKAGKYTMYDINGSPYPNTPELFEKNYEIVRPGVARMKHSAPAEFEILEDEKTTEPRHKVGDYRRVGGEYAIDKSIFERTYKIVSHPYASKYSSMASPKT